ncbi:MAG: hypothetical protein ABSD85_12760 [Acidimicrobiales bacterium]
MSSDLSDLFAAARAVELRPAPAPAPAVTASPRAASASLLAGAEPAEERERPRPPRRRRVELPPGAPPSSLLAALWLSFCLGAGDWRPRPLACCGGDSSGALGKGGAGRVSPIFGLAGKSGTSVPPLSAGAASGLRAP